eukprot:gene11245-13291_t
MSEGFKAEMCTMLRRCLKAVSGKISKTRGGTKADTISVPMYTVAGKRMSLEQLLRDKINQRSRGGSHQLRKAFKLVDKDGNGFIDLGEFRQFLSKLHIDMKTRLGFDDGAGFDDGVRRAAQLEHVQAIMRLYD